MAKTICKIKELENSVNIKFRVDGKIIYKEFSFINYFYIKAEDLDIVSHILRPRIEILKQ